MARTIRNAGSAPIYRETENLMLLCIEMVERTPNSVGIRQLSKRLIDTLLDGLTVIGLAFFMSIIPFTHTLWAAL